MDLEKRYSIEQLMSMEFIRLLYDNQLDNYRNCEMRSPDAEPNSIRLHMAFVLNESVHRHITLNKRKYESFSRIEDAFEQECMRLKLEEGGHEPRFSHQRSRQDDDRLYLPIDKLQELLKANFDGLEADRLFEKIRRVCLDDEVEFKEVESAV